VLLLSYRDSDPHGCHMGALCVRGHRQAVALCVRVVVVANRGSRFGHRHVGSCTLFLSSCTGSV